jgi:hypothetical protein
VNIVLLLVLGLLFVACALVKHRVHTLNITLVPPIAPPAPADGSVVQLDAYRVRRATATATGYRSRSHSAS